MPSSCIVRPSFNERKTSLSMNGRSMFSSKSVARLVPRRATDPLRVEARGSVTERGPNADIGKNQTWDGSDSKRTYGDKSRIMSPTQDGEKRTPREIVNRLLKDVSIRNIALQLRQQAINLINKPF